MINLIYGLPGTGKTTMIANQIKSDVACERKVILIVPEQQTVEVEREMLKILPPSAQLSFEVLNFSRLANKLFRIFGGLSYNYITNGMKNLFMKRTLLELAPMLSEYKLRALGDSALPSLMLSQINEFKINGISATKLDLASGSLEEGHPLKSKLADFAMIYQSYEGLVTNSYDDNSNDLEKLYNILCSHNFFDGYSVYIDSFSSFTAYEHKIIDRIFKQADKTVVTIPSSDPSCKDIHLTSVNNTSARLRAVAGSEAEITILKTPYRATTDELKTIHKHLWDFSLDTKKLKNTPTPGSVSITECNDPYDESTAVANTVLSLLQNGYRRKEIAVIAGDMESYRGIIDSAFEKAQIPYFMSEKTDLISEPLITFILSAFSIKLKNWRQADVMAYLKTGLTDISQNDIDVFEIYLSTWKINGSRFFEEFWSMNPDGYNAQISPRGLKILETANEVKNRLVAPLSEFFTRLDAAKNVADLCDATYEFFKSQKLSEKLETRARHAHRSRDKKTALEYAGTHKAFIKVLSDISAAFNDTEMSLEEFSSSLKLVLSNTDISTIPTAADEVLLGSASMLRATGIRCAILIGMCDGKFPVKTVESNFFSDNEKALLRGLDIELSSDTVSQSSEELLYTYRAMTLPSDKLLIFYHTTSLGEGFKPSIAVNRIMTLLPHVKAQKYSSSSEKDRLMSRKLSFEMIHSVKDPATRAALREIFASDEDFYQLLKQTEKPISDVNCYVDDKHADIIFGNKIYLTQSKLEKYIKCHFSYYCRYILNLRETETASFNYADTGTFIHRILEVFIRSTVNENGFRRDVTDEEIEKTVIAEAQSYINTIFKSELPPSKRLAHHFNRLKKLAILISKDLYRELLESKFTPTFFELEIGRGPNSPLPPYELLLKDGTRVLIGGVVDRVDIFRRENEIYIKIVDYKTGSKKFSLSDIEKGLNTQMLLYLFALCNSKSKVLEEQLDYKDGDCLKPAGVMYISTLVSPVDASVGTPQSIIMEKAAENIEREGLVLNDEDILKAINEKLEPKYLANVTTDKHGNLKGKALTSAEDFEAIEVLINNTIIDIATEMKSGNASIAPLNEKNSSPCTYCKMKQFCRVNIENTDVPESDGDTPTDEE